MAGIDLNTVEEEDEAEAEALPLPRAGARGAVSLELWRFSTRAQKIFYSEDFLSIDSSNRRLEPGAWPS